MHTSYHIYGVWAMPRGRSRRTHDLANVQWRHTLHPHTHPAEAAAPSTTPASHPSDINTYQSIHDCTRPQLISDCTPFPISCLPMSKSAHPPRDRPTLILIGHPNERNPLTTCQRTRAMASGREQAAPHSITTLTSLRQRHQHPRGRRPPPRAVSASTTTHLAHLLVSPPPW